MNRTKLASVLVGIVVVAVTLAGCAGGNGGTPGDGGQDRDLQAGKGAIEGILVDDRFRPIHLVEDPQNEFQTTGFVLLQETGQQVKTTENGEFSFRNLEPGRYTLRVTAAGHEAVPQTVDVQANLFTEAPPIVARRVTTLDDVILTEEFSVFIPCAYAVPLVGLITFNCVLDLSGDSFRSSVNKNYSMYPTLTYVVSEVKVQNPGHYAMPLRDSGLACPCYARTDIQGGDYGKAIIKNDPDEPYEEGYAAWTHDKNLNIGLFYAGDVETPVGMAGTAMGIRADFLVSLFLSEPEGDIEEYCVICE